ncbi:UDP-N-acetylglucosamine 2-epimerase [Butyrivibrio proteoclasticus B316]|uniref:UDP-N-acetylglucosamine 2-epimerase n=1 Tax=Butyrivibrio proteoclasticus (strain ATCC 51982 / DSM 14932 / B316) TaxID=515622 RepID=E0RZI0_BUTPB|nr:UDP-N-acetylglucosamine 2-epimerase [Butyrivibrio proteoclasticus]ADL33177.1 UDP-N-acetylglucosamine 2-epimerase [Butyrivibrio proteoclasticus B316]
MKKVAIVTATRAEYGLLSPVIRKLREYESSDFKVDLIVTGTHLSDTYGNTVSEIENDNIRVDYRINISVDNASDVDVSFNQADTLVKFTKHFAKERYDAVILLGDRYEMLAIAIAAGNTKTPIFHLCGGDTTEGAIDEWIRHSITKMSYLHFTTNGISRKRVVQLGEDPQRVFNFGSTSIDNIMRIADMSKVDALRSVGLYDCTYAVCTYHPVTMENESVDYQIGEFIKAIKAFPDIQFIVTKSNADQGGNRINELLDEAAENMDNMHVYTSLGVKRYLSLMKYSEFVLGNSSSGIIETPAFHVPTVNIGDRQRGRLQSDSIINCQPDSLSIISAIKKAMSEEHKAICKDVISPYGDGHAAERIAEKIVEVIKEGRIDLKKKFYDLI